MSAVQDGKQYIIMNVGTSTVFDLAKGDPSNGTLIQGWELLVKEYNENTDHQVWYAHFQFHDTIGDWYSFTNRGTGTAIDSGGLVNENKQLHAWVDQGKGNENQQWLLSPIAQAGVKLYQSNGTRLT
ncbi:uncharacterized protein KY384_008201 [Bacidia gigantensis]|uniref:uncharacterized protein n=1 Tax=Bacidia gigantensis TaxID=2732470 RepID=UPI001D03854B|nr:uncharacterized protein KY384_008201 [Bacidia gigantensis]KAG8526772.1 hypothetical protein KY384_008201 [Bacidia gigantensis]